MAIDTGDIVPDLDLALSSGQTRRLSSYRGRWLVLYFYPKDSTPGCTTEGIDFNALLADFDAADATILGVSRDSLKSHQNFCAKQGFKFDLVSDADESVCNAFDVIKPKKLYGRDYVGIERSTFLIDPTGRVVHAWRPVKVPGHADAVLAKLRELQAA
ncbi:peroxiredoxin [Lysobacter claricitrinus]|uniref:peroxiredoxin n=1 Tax=Lysobacter claricitrinus TaxID=3367728 RepID=UPI0037DADB25